MDKVVMTPKLPKSQANYVEKVDLSRGSHRQITVECEFQVSFKCRKTWTAEYREICRTMERNDGKVICLYCSRAIKYSGRNNPNCQYKNLKDDIFKSINSEEKAYLLGWVASDGTIAENNTITISIKKQDEYILHVLNEIICGELPINDRPNDMKALSICSKEMCDDACRLLKIDRGKKSDVVGFPSLDNENLTWAFLRGLFDGDGHVVDMSKVSNPKCCISSTSINMKNGIADFYKSICYISDGAIEWWSTNAIDFLGKIYDGCEPHLCLSRKELAYLDWCCWVPALMKKGTIGRLPLFKWYKSDVNAVPPYKKRPSDSGWDLTLIRKIRECGLMTLYGTGIKITPDYGWYFDIVPRSSIIDSGYILANSVGVIDRSYRGEVMAALIKIDQSKPDLDLPARLVQIIPRPIIHFDFLQVDTLDITERGEGGFGSTGQ